VWVSQAEAEQDIEITVIDNGDLTALPNLLQQSVDKLDDATDNLFSKVGSILDEFTSTINEAVNDLEAQTLAVEDVVVSSFNQIIGPIEATQRVAGILDFMKRRALNLKSILEDEVEGAFISNDDPLFGNFLSGMLAIRDEKNTAREAGRDASVHQDLAVRRINPDLIDTFIAKSDQDLREVSAKHYGTPDEWQSLMHFNHLDSSRLDAGQVIFVPREIPRSDC
jgi:hypothetical protein